MLGLSLYARLAAVAMVVLALAGLVWKADRMLAAREAVGYARRAAEDAAAAEAQAASNRDLQRAAELRYTVRAASREKFFSTTSKEARDASAPLAACPVPADAVRVLNTARTCASDDRSPACGAGVELPRP